VTDTSSVQSLIENKNKSADAPPSVDEPENEDGNARIQSASFWQDNNHILHTPRQSSFHSQNGNPSPSNSPPHNFSPNDHIPHTLGQSSSHNQNGDPSPSNSPPHNFPPNDHLRNQVNNDQPTPTVTYDSSPRQAIHLMPVASTEASTTTRFSNKGSFNTENTAIKQVNNFYGNVKVSRCSFPMGWTIYEVDDTQDLGTGININQEEHEPSPALLHCVGVPLVVSSIPTNGKC
jgi:hypothetical protein